MSVKIDLTPLQAAVYGFVQRHHFISALEINCRNPDLILLSVEQALEFLANQRMVRRVGASPVRYSPNDLDLNRKDKAVEKENEKELVSHEQDTLQV